jgi:hypothetical protein
MNQHGCNYPWCSNIRTCAGDFEHFSEVWKIPATGEQGSNRMRTVDLCIWFNEDIEPAPTIHIDIGAGATGVDLKLDEAVVLYERIRRAIEAVASGTNFNPARIIGKRVDQ